MPYYFKCLTGIHVFERARFHGIRNSFHTFIDRLMQARAFEIFDNLKNLRVNVGDGEFLSFLKLSL